MVEVEQVEAATRQIQSDDVNLQRGTRLLEEILCGRLHSK